MHDTERIVTVIMIRTTAKSVYHPASGQSIVMIRGSGRVRFIGGSPLVNAKCLNNR
jgi:acetyl-CoA carboxylase carboxyltransferase component